MPLYEIHHTYPLSASQKSQFAKAITHLHSTTFLTPSLFVNIIFHFHPDSSAEDPSAPLYFLAGEPTSPPSGPNRILAMVRTSETRTKEVYDRVASQLEESWYAVIDGAKANGDTTNGDTTNGEVKVRGLEKMHFIVFYPMLAARENGVTIPSAGNEGTWLKDNMPYFAKMAKAGDGDFAGMLAEVEQRADLRKMLD